jgi:phosphate acetyltransferase
VPDPLLELLRASGGEFVPYEASVGVGYEQARADEPRALEAIVARYRALAADCDTVAITAIQAQP